MQPKDADLGLKIQPEVEIRGRTNEGIQLKLPDLYVLDIHSGLTA